MAGIGDLSSGELEEEADLENFQKSPETVTAFIKELSNWQKRVTKAAIPHRLAYAYGKSKEIFADLQKSLVAEKKSHFDPKHFATFFGDSSGDLDQLFGDLQSNQRNALFERLHTELKQILPKGQQLEINELTNTIKHFFVEVRDVMKMTEFNQILDKVVDQGRSYALRWKELAEMLSQDRFFNYDLTNRQKRRQKRLGIDMLKHMERMQGHDLILKLTDFHHQLEENIKKTILCEIVIPHKEIERQTRQETIRMATQGTSTSHNIAQRTTLVPTGCAEIAMKLNKASSALQDKARNMKNTEEERKAHQISSLVDTMRVLDRSLKELHHTSDGTSWTDKVKKLLSLTSELSTTQEELKIAECLISNAGREKGPLKPSEKVTGILKELGDLLREIRQLPCRRNISALNNLSSDLIEMIENMIRDAETNRRQVTSALETCKEIGEQLCVLQQVPRRYQNMVLQVKLCSLTSTLQKEIQALQKIETLKVQERQCGDLGPFPSWLRDNGLKPLKDLHERLRTDLSELKDIEELFQRNRLLTSLDDSSKELCYKITELHKTDVVTKLFITEARKKYKKLCNAVQPVPYLRDKLYSIDKVFVEGSIDIFSPSSRTWKQLKPYHAVLGSLKFTRRIILGEPGFGKSALSLQLVYDWCHNIDVTQLKNTDILIFLRLRQLGGFKSIYKAIKRFIVPGNNEINVDIVKDILQSSQSVVIILDGIDEYPVEDDDRTEQNDILKTIYGEMFPNSKVILTTRFISKEDQNFAVKMKLNGFDSIARESYLRKALVDVDHKETITTKLDLQENPFLNDLFQVPLFFVMFAHMAHEKKNVDPLDTVTSFFNYVMCCLQEHTEKKFEDENVQKYYLYKNPKDHISLDKVAFDGLRNNQVMWSEEELCEKMGQDLYDRYVQIGILMKDEIDDLLTDYGDDISTPQEVRFYHKIFQEFFAAFHLARYAHISTFESLALQLRGMSPYDMQYLYRFACGLGTDRASDKIIHYLNTLKGGKKFAILCILEKSGDFENILDTLKSLCANVIIFKQESNRLLQRSQALLLHAASRKEIPILGMMLVQNLRYVDPDGRHIHLRSGLQLSSLNTLLSLEINERKRKIENNLLNNIFSYASNCVALKVLCFRNCLLPQAVPLEFLSGLHAKEVEVTWFPKSFKRFQLNVKTGLWEVKNRQMTKEEYNIVKMLFAH